MSVPVKVFGCRDDEAIHALKWPASKKHQGTKSRGVGQLQCRGRYGDLATKPGVRSSDLSGFRDRFVAKHGRMLRCARAICGKHDKIDRATAGESSAPMRALALPAVSQQE